LGLHPSISGSARLKDIYDFMFSISVFYQVRFCGLRRTCVQEDGRHMKIRAALRLNGDLHYLAMFVS
jgi:hypothetical protein